ncbi:MAG: caspase family protein [Proteobacteria bacterium]|nr:caspase family protein [Pseudomonadota bacterium]
MRRGVQFVMALGLALVGSVDVLAQPARAPVATEKRVALVIGNGAYKEAPLKNPVNDARAMATALQGLGFEIIKRENASQKDMNRAIGEFATRLTGGGTGLFYYAGHGMQVKGRNYLLPVDAEIGSEMSVRTEAVDVDQVLDNMVILDACRNNPFERRFRGSAGGLAQIDAPKGALIAYATAPGKVAADGDGANGLYTAELLRAISEPNLRIEDVFKRVRSRVAAATNDLQVPWEASSLVGDFYFKQQADNTQIEMTFWQSIQNSNDPHDFQSYLDQFPDGKFVSLARNRMRALQSAAERSQEQQRAADAQRQAESQRSAKADEAKRRAEADRLATLEAELKRLSALNEQQRQASAPAETVPAALPAAAPPPRAPVAPTPPPAPASAPPQIAAPQVALSAPPRASLDGKWTGQGGMWQYDLTVSGGEINGRVTCGNSIYRLRTKLGEDQMLDATADRLTPSGFAPLSIGITGVFPTIDAPRTGTSGTNICNQTAPITLQRASAG